MDLIYPCAAPASTALLILSLIRPKWPLREVVCSSIPVWHCCGPLFLPQVANAIGDDEPRSVVQMEQAPRHHSTHERGAVVKAGMVENRSSEMSVGMLSPSSAAEVCGADEGRYNTGAILSQGAFDVQSIRASQTADPRAKQTHPSGPARRLAKVNSRPGDGDSVGSMPAGRFHLGEVVESFLSQPLLAGLLLPAAAPPPAWPPRT